MAQLQPSMQPAEPVEHGQATWCRREMTLERRKELIQAGQVEYVPEIGHCVSVSANAIVGVCTEVGRKERNNRSAASEKADLKYCQQQAN